VCEVSSVLNQAKEQKMATRRKIAKLVAPKRFEVMEEPLRSPKENEILIRILSAGLCHSEMPTYLGKSAIAIREDGTYFKNENIKYPVELGHESVGVIEEVGSAVKNFKAGDYVSGPIRPSFASHVIMDPSTKPLAKIPDSVKELKYCLAEPLMCASNIVRAANPEFGDYVAVIGCGFMGLLCLSGVARSTAFEVIAIDLIDSRLEWAKKLGATKTINPKKVDAVNAVKEITRGHGVDVAVEVTGRMAGFSLACDIIRGDGPVDSGRGRGKILIPSLYSFPETMNAGYQLMFKSPIIHSTHPWYSMDYMDDMKKGIEGFVRGIFPLDKLITHEFSLEDIQKGFELMEHPGEDYLKGIILP